MKYFKSLTLFFTLLIILLLPCMPAGAFGPITGGNVYYGRATTTYPVLNAETFTDSSFLNKYVGSNRNEYNIAPAFWKESRSKGASSMPYYLGYDTVFKHEDDDNTYSMYYQYDLEGALKEAASKGDLRISYSATLTNDKHWNVERHWSTKTAYPSTWVKTSSKYLVEHETDDIESDWTGTRGKHNFVSIGTFPTNYKLYFGALGQACTCGSSKVADINIVLADTVGPRVVSIYTSRLNPDGSMEPFVDFRGGDTLYINLEFNENIRFANDTPMSVLESPKLKMLIKRINDNVQETGIDVEAFLVSLDGNTLTFRYDVPDSYEIGGQSVKPNYYIYQIAPYSAQTSWVSASKDYDLKLFGKKTGTKYLDTTRKTTSMIVDLAGNPIDTSGSTVALKSVAYMDNVPAVVRKIDVARTVDTDSSKVGISDVYARIGEKIGFFVNFSEEMLYRRRGDGALLRPSNIYRDKDNKELGYDMQNPFGTEEIHLTAALNVTKNSQPVTAVAKYITTIQDGLNSTKISKVYFELNEPVSSDMNPRVYSSGEKLPIGINRIYIDTGMDKYVLADVRGNDYDRFGSIELINAPDGERIMPAQQVYLDTIPPTANTTLLPGSDGYEPVSYEGGGNPTEFFFPINVYDSPAWGEEFRSGTNGAVGAFIWRDTTPGNTSDYVFEYAVTGSPDKPAEEAYKTGVTGKQYTFTQIDSGNYIHLRLLDEVLYNIGSSNLVIKPVDNAGNIGNVPLKLDYEMDRVGPTIIRHGYRNNFDYDSGYIIANMAAMDASGIAKVEYQWTLPDVVPLETGWTVTGSVYGESGTEKFRIFNIAKFNLEPDVKHCYDLQIRATDILGQTSYKSFYFEYDLILPKYNIELVSGPEELNPRHSVKMFFTEGNEYFPAAGAADRLLVLVKKPGIDNEYWGRYFNYMRGDIIGADNATDIFDVGPDAEGWVSVEHETNKVIWYGDDIYSHIYGETYELSPLTNQDKSELYEYINRSYRQIDLKVIAILSSTIYGHDALIGIPDDELCARDTYTFNFAAGDGVAPGSRVHFADITAKSKVTHGSFYEPSKVAPTGGLPYGVLEMPSSLDGAVFNVSLKNQRVLAYGIMDIDFDSTDTHFALYKTGDEDTPLFTAPLIPKISQNITIPAGVALETGDYKAVVSIRSKTTGRVDKNEYTSIYIDRRTLDTYGVTQVRTRVNYRENPTSGPFVYPDTAITDYAISPGNRPAEILVSADMGADQTIVFKAENLESLKYFSNTHYAAYIRVWSETANDIDRVGSGMVIPTERYPWIYFTGEIEYKTIYHQSAYLEYINDCLFSTSPGTAAIIPIVPGENIIKYQIVFPSTGYSTPVETLRIQAGESNPTIKMKLSSNKSDGITAAGVVASVDFVESAVVSPDTLHVGMAFPNGAVRDEELAADFTEDRQVMLTKTGDYYFYVRDKYHNFGFTKVTIDYIDMEAPSLEVTDLSDEDLNTFSFKVDITDDMDSGTCMLYIGFDDSYSEVLGNDMGTFFEVPSDSGVWSAKAPSASGIYEAEVSSSGGKKTVTFTGAFRYDPTDSSDTVTRTIKLYAVDGAGNESEEYTVTLNTRNEPAKYAGGVLADGGFAASFTKPVLLITPDEKAIKPVYSHTKTHMPYFTNGIYAVEYTDIFGDDYSENIEVDQFDSLYNCTVSISETAPTNRNVQVLINTGFNTDITLELPESIPGAVIEPSYDSFGAVVGAAITMSQNGSISFSLKPKDSAYPAQTRTVVISNIDKTPPVVTLEWVYTADVVEGKTGGEIIVSLTANEELKALETGTTHMFTLYDQEPYTFIYEDLAGNGGSITAVPPAVILEKTRVELDNVAPDYDFAIYKGEKGASIKVGGYNKEQYEALAGKAEAFPLFSEVLQIKFNIYDENQTMITLEDNPETGVSLIGNTVTVTDNAQFKVVITDANNNRTEVPISITKADRIPPAGTVSYVEVDENIVRAYLELNDNAPGKITLKNTYGVMIETEPGEYQGMYYHEFLDNESFTFLFADAAGNMGSVTAAVTSIDTGMPVGTVSEWIPYFIDSNGNAHNGVLSDRVINSDVSVYIRFNKPVKSVTPSIVDGIGDIKDISVYHTGDSATVVFRRNAKVKLAFTAMNNRTGSTFLEVDIIDKKAPVVTAEKTSTGSGPAVYRFTVDEDVFFEGEDVSAPGRVFTKTFELNGEYDLIFTDRVGNSASVRVIVSGIDRTPPSISVTGLPATREAIDAYNKANGTSIQPVASTQPVSIKASMDEKGTITFRGVKYSVVADQQVTLTVDSSGTYEIVAADEAGMTTRYSFRIDCIDRTKPQILLPGGTLFVRQGTSVEEFTETAMADVFASDNYDASPAVEISSSLDAGQLNTPDIYSIEFTATDSAGNVRTASCFVQVYDKDLLEVLINGKLSQPRGTLFVGVDSSRRVNVQVNNMLEGPGGTEPYTLYWKQGLNTPGQMKDAKEFSGSFTALQDDFYTIYIVTQSRGSFITHIYVQQ